MKSFKDIVKETVNPPKSEDEQAFVAKHIAKKKDHPVAADGQFIAKTKKDKTKAASYENGEDKDVYEAADVHTKRADKKAVIVHNVDPNTGESKTTTRKTRTGEIKVEAAEGLDEDISKMSHGRLKWHMNTGVPHGSYTDKEMKSERDRRLKTGEGDAYKKAKAGLYEDTQLDELSPNTLHGYVKKAAGNMAGNSAANAAIAAVQVDKPKTKKADRKDLIRNIRNRMKGIASASGRLADKANMAEDTITEAFSAGSLKLKDGSTVLLDKENAKAVNALFGELNSSNKKKMETKMMESKKGFSEIVKFAKEAL